MNDLFGLWYDIQKAGLHNLCGRCEHSSDYTKIFMTYRDYLFHEQFIFVERRRYTGYRISTDGQPIIVRTLKPAFDYLEKFLLEAIKKSENYTVVTVAEYSKLIGQIKLNHYIDFGTRLTDLKRYNEYIIKKNLRH